MSTKLLNIVERIKQITGKPAISYQGGYLCYCPGHGDKDKPSLSVSDPGDKIFLNCFVRSGNCSFHQLVEIIGIPESEYYHNYQEHVKNIKEEREKQFPKKKKQIQQSQSIKSIDPLTSKRYYNNLLEYSTFQGFTREIYEQEGWEDFLYIFYEKDENGKIISSKKVPSIKIPTKNGIRFRILDPNYSKFMTTKGYKPCWYLLEKAITIAKDRSQSLIICNGESSTIAAQSLGLPATCLAMGEGQKVKSELVEELKSLWQGNIVLALDNDGAGKNGTLTRLKVLQDAGFTCIGVQFETDQKGYDLSNFCRDWQSLESEKIYKKLIELSRIEHIEEKVSEVKKIAEIFTKDLTIEERAKLPANFSDLFSMFRTDVGTSYRFVAQHGHNIKYCHPWKSWMFWDGKKWIDDNIGEIFRRGLLTIESLVNNWLQMPDSDEKESLRDYIIELQAKGKIRNFIEIAKNAPSVYVLPDQFDNDPWLLNCQNGFVNLLTGKLTAHDSKTYVTKITIANYEPESSCPIWLSFLSKIMDGNQNLVKYLQKAVGYCLTANTMEKALFFLYGATGDNGKSTFLETISTILGTYALAKFPMQALLDDAHNSTSANPSPYIAQLCGVRFVSGSELSGNKKLNEETIKDLTGGIDSISAKRLYQNPFTFKPTHKLFMFGNDKPIIPRSAKAVWNRLKTIPFLVSIPKEQQDLDLPFKLLEEKAGILNWAIQGCLEWQRERLGMPDEIEAANEAYRQEMDIVNFFLQEECSFSPEFTVKAQNLYSHYQDWCKKNGHHFYNQQSFGKELKAHNYENYKGAKGYSYWRGIELKAEREIAELNQALQQHLTTQKSKQH